MSINLKKCEKGTTLVEMLVAIAVFAIASIFLITIFVTAIMVNKKTLDNMITNSLFRMVNEYATSKIKEEVPIKNMAGTDITIDPDDPAKPFESEEFSVKSDALEYYMGLEKNNGLEFLDYDNYYFTVELIKTEEPVVKNYIYTYVIQLHHKDKTTGNFEVVRSIQTRVHKKLY